MNKENCTKGPVYHQEGHTPHFQGTVMREEGQGETIALTYNDEHGANAELIAEAFNVLHETGCTPAELAQAVKSLVGSLDEMCEEMNWTESGSSQHHAWDRAKALLSKYQPVTPA